MSASEALSAVKTIYSIVCKVKENRTELLRLCNRISHVILSLEDVKARDIRLLRRSLGDRTWNRGEIAAEINRLNEDLKNYMGVHTVNPLLLFSHEQQYSMLSASIEEITVKLAELDLRLGSRGGDAWAGSIVAQARVNQAHARELAMEMTRSISGKEGLRYESIPLQAIAESARTSVEICGLLKFPGLNDQHTMVLDVKIDTSYDEILQLITDAGYVRPDLLNGQNELQITVVDGDSCYDATSARGLQISRSEPLRWWYNKYAEYHGTALVSTPGHTIAEVNLNQGGIWAGGVLFQFHRTLRVPDSSYRAGDLPPDLGQYPVLPLSGLDTARLPAELRSKHGFLVPMFRKEALWVSFAGAFGNAVKVSVGGVNALSGIVNKAITPLTVEQDYIISGRQSRLDGIVTGPGIVRQFVATTLGHGYSIEEQVAGKAVEGGLQFDIFSLRPTQGTFQLPPLGHLDDLKTSGELGIPSNSFASNGITAEWTPGDHRRRVSCCSTLNAVYYRSVASSLMFPSSSMARRNTASGVLPRVGSTLSALPFGLAPGGQIAQRIKHDLSEADSDRPPTSPMGVAAGGQIRQQIWGDKNTRIYDEEHGHRLNVHIVSPEIWEHITGFPAPIIPITRELYHSHNIPWHPSYEDLESLSNTHRPKVSDVLAKVKSVAQLDEERTGIVTNTYSFASCEAPQEVINFAMDRVSPLHIGSTHIPPRHNTKRQRGLSDAGSSAQTKYPRTS
ncbi:hypothetical protein B0H11DRAFT_1959242 [Mycena galericulata]|nr:hypothetical protein B0H11DRAFT_1959242 [Mycena galericulata]